MGPLMGSLLDNNPGIIGYRLVFGLLAIFSIIGLIASFRFKKLIKN